MARHILRFRPQILRLLTVVCFFHFSGLNNGFAFFSVTPAQAQPINFAPVFMRTLCSAVGPFHWGRVFRFRGWRRAILSSSRTLQLSSRTALRRYHPQIFLSGVRNWRYSTPNPRSLILPASPQALTPSSGRERKESWHNLKALFEPVKGGFGIKINNPDLENRLRADKSHLPAAMRPGFMRRNYVDADSKGGDADSLNDEARHAI